MGFIAARLCTSHCHAVASSVPCSFRALRWYDTFFHSAIVAPLRGGGSTAGDETRGHGARLHWQAIP